MMGPNQLQAAIDAHNRNKPTGAALNQQYGAVDSSMNPAAANADALRRETAAIVGKHGQRAADSYREYAKRFMQDKEQMLGNASSAVSRLSGGRMDAPALAGLYAAPAHELDRARTDLDATRGIMEQANQMRAAGNDTYFKHVESAIPVVAARMKDKLTSGFVDQANAWNDGTQMLRAKAMDWELSERERLAKEKELSQADMKFEAMRQGSALREQTLAAQRAIIEDPKASHQQKERASQVLADAFGKSDADWAREVADQSWGAGTGRALFEPSAEESEQVAVRRVQGERIGQAGRQVAQAGEARADAILRGPFGLLRPQRPGTQRVSADDVKTAAPAAAKDSSKRGRRERGTPLVVAEQSTPGRRKRGEPRVFATPGRADGGRPKRNVRAAAAQQDAKSKAAAVSVLNALNKAGPQRPKIANRKEREAAGRMWEEAVQVLQAHSYGTPVDRAELYDAARIVTSDPNKAEKIAGVTEEELRTEMLQNSTFTDGETKETYDFDSLVDQVWTWANGDGKEDPMTFPELRAMLRDQFELDRDAIEQLFKLAGITAKTGRVN